MNENHHSAAARYCELIRRHERMLRRLCLWRAHGDPNRADDYFQEVALSLWEQLPDILPDIPLQQERSYVKKAARLALSHCSRKKQPDMQKLQIEMTLALDRHSSENEMLLDNLMEALPEDDCLVVKYYRAGFPTSAIARILGTNPNAVSQHLHRAIVKMCRIYENDINTLKKIHHEQ